MGIVSSKGSAIAYERRSIPTVVFPSRTAAMPVLFLSRMDEVVVATWLVF